MGQAEAILKDDAKNSRRAQRDRLAVGAVVGGIVLSVGLVSMRTTSEQWYVDNYREGGRNIGHDGPLDRTVRPGETNPHTQAERDDGAEEAP